MVASADTARVFFAAWPAPETQRVLGDIAQRAQGGCGGRAVAVRNIHLTLVFLGDLPRDRVSALESLAAAVSSPRFSMVVDRLEYWRHNRILWAGLRTCPEALGALVARLEQALGESGFGVDRRPYVPHVTLLRNARRAPAEDRCGAVPWPVTRFALVESVPRGRGREYEILRKWPLFG